MFGEGYMTHTSHKLPPCICKATHARWKECQNNLLPLEIALGIGKGKQPMFNHVFEHNAFTLGDPRD